eukprot:scaffold64930_cov48-Cyclotella_meneghiniana.AAC.1
MQTYPRATPILVHTMTTGDDWYDNDRSFPHRPMKYHCMTMSLVNEWRIILIRRVRSHSNVIVDVAFDGTRWYDCRHF